MSQVVQIALWLVLLLPSITFHEFMHAYAAYKLGDPTAKDAGRLTLNPLKHIDPVGTVILPILLAVLSSGRWVFGYAKPVPYNPRYFKNIRRDDVLVGLAGPSANLLLAVVGAALTWVSVFTSGALPDLWVLVVWLIGHQLALTNLVLLFFNLLPIPPLDGSSLIMALLPDSALPHWYRLQRYSLPLLIVLLWVLPALTHVDPVGWYFGYTARWALDLLTANPSFGA